jgi:hypothetical protein
MKNKTFLGTYFDHDAVMNLVAFTNIFSWVVLVVYVCQMLLSIGVFVLQVVRGDMVGLGATDYLQNVLFLIEQPFRGFVYFIVLQAVGKVLLMFMDIEINTRRAARQDNSRAN